MSEQLIDQVENARALAQVPSIYMFAGVQLAQYSGGRRAMLRGVMRKYADLSGTMLGWVLVYGLTLDLKTFVSTFAYPEAALEQAVAFADQHSANEDAALQIASSIFNAIDAVMVTPTGESEGDPKK